MASIYSSILLLFLASTCAVDVPDFIKICHRSHPDIHECMKDSVEGLRPYLKSGYPEYHIPSVEPIIIKDLIKEEAAGLKVATTDVVAHGGSDYIINDIGVNLDNYQFEVDMLLPKLIIDAKYSLEGKLVMIPLRGNGNFFANLTDCSAKSILQGVIFQKDGEDHLKIVSNILKLKVGGGHVKLDNLFGGDKTLNEVINDTINKNLAVFIKELMPFIEKGLAANFMETGNKIIEPYTIHQLFPID